MELYSIAMLLEKQTFKLGQVVLREGTEPENFYIIFKGRCLVKFIILSLQIGKEEIIVRDTKMMGISKELKLRKFNTGKIDCKILKIKKIDKDGTKDKER